MPKDYKLTGVRQAFEDADQYGNITWSVTIDGETEHALLKTRPENEPDVGDVVYGHLEPTKSGRATWLKKDQKEDEGGSYPAPQAAQGANPSPNGQSREKSIKDAVIYKEACAFERSEPEAGMPAAVRKAKVMYQLVECVAIPSDQPEPEEAEAPF
tara:strand:- start:1467 stop:1934 length:468 start_codon:yes stop_codon:yes gene_type:complete